MPAILRGFRPILRSLGRSRGFTAAAILTLGLGMGASAAIYTLLQRVVLDPLPYPDPDRLVRVRNPVPGVGADEEWNLSSAQYFYFTQHAHLLAQIGVYSQDGSNFTSTQAPQRVRVASVSAPVLGLIGAHPARGRLLGADDDRPGAAPVVMLSYNFWQRQFGGDATVVGSTIRLDDRPFQVIGVMARGVELPPDRGETVRTASDLWVTRQLDPAGPFYNNHVLPAIARLAPGATPTAAERELAQLRSQLPAAFPRAYSQEFFDRYGFHTRLYDLKQFVVGDVARNLWILFAAVGLVLLIACANVANLLLVRLEGRRRDTAIRTALGAGWRELSGDALREGAVLATAGGALALLLGYLSTRWLVSLAPSGLPRLEEVRLDGHSLAFALGMAVAVALALALVPALQFRSPRNVGSLSEGGRGGTAGVDRHRLRGALVISQVALALILVVSAGLLLRSFTRLRSVNPGVNPGGVLTVQLYLPYQRYDSVSKVWRFYSALFERLRAAPGVSAAGVSEGLPFQDSYGCTVQGFEDKAVYQRVKDANMTTCAGQEATSPGFLESLGIPLIAGRMFTAGDNAQPGAGAVVVSKAFADRFWPGEDPIGKGVNPNGRDGPTFYHVVGVVGDVHGSSLDDAPAIAIYYPVVPMATVRFNAPRGVYLTVRTSKGAPLSYLAAVRNAVAAIDPEIPLANAMSMDTIVAQSMSRLTFTMTLLAIAGVVALLLAAIGLYGLISYVVGRRTNEIGVRLALGAQPGQVQGMIVRGAVGLTLVGLVCGIAGAAVFTRVLRGLLYGVAASDPVSYLIACAVLGTVAAVAAWVPARRAARVDPTVALRFE
jgi:putative ABC transport system permease protein